MVALQKTLDLVVKEVEGCFLTKRRCPDGKTSIVETAFDHALTSLKLFELTGDRKYLQKGISHALENSIRDKSGMKWNFSPLVMDIPPDADSTTMNLLLITMASKHNLPFPDYYAANANLQQFRTLADSSGGIKTFFGIRANNPADPVVNTLVAFLFVLNARSDAVYKKLKEYLRKQVRQLPTNPNISHYYIKGAYFAERMTKLSFYDPEILGKKERKILDAYILESRPRNSLETALFSIGASYQGLPNRVSELNRKLRAKRMHNGLWHFGTIYVQKTPRFNYGNERLTTLFALEALKLEEEGVNRRENILAQLK